MVGLLHAMAFMELLLIGWVIWNNKPFYLFCCDTKPLHKANAAPTKQHRFHQPTRKPRPTQFPITWPEGIGQVTLGRIWVSWFVPATNQISTRSMGRITIFSDGRKRLWKRMWIGSFEKNTTFDKKYITYFFRVGLLQPESCKLSWNQPTELCFLHFAIIQLAYICVK